MKKILITALVLAGFSATAQVKVGANPTTLATDANFQVEATDGTQFFINKPNGNVGIGTTTPDTKLHLFNGNVASNFVTLGGTQRVADGLNKLLIFNHGYWTGNREVASIGVLTSSSVSGSGTGLGNLVFNTGTSGNGDGGSTSTERMRIDTNGNVGIGTPTPDTKLHLFNGNVASNFVTLGGTQRVADGLNKLLIFNHGYWTGNREVASIGVLTSSSAGGSGTGLGNLVFNTGTSGDGDGGSTSTERMRIDQGGNVGIGTLLPTSKLQVVGLPVHASNAAAITAGLTAGAFYHAGDGIVRVVF